MGTATQFFWRGSSGALLVPRSSETTAKPLASVQTTGGLYTIPDPSAPTPSAEEEEWASLLSSERKTLARRRIRPRTVNKAIREVRYGK